MKKLIIAACGIIMAAGANVYVSQSKVSDNDPLTFDLEALADVEHRTIGGNNVLWATGGSEVYMLTSFGMVRCDATTPYWCHFIQNSNHTAISGTGHLRDHF